MDKEQNDLPIDHAAEIRKGWIARITFTLFMPVILIGGYTLVILALVMIPVLVLSLSHYFFDDTLDLALISILLALPLGFSVAILFSKRLRGACARAWREILATK